MTIDDETLLAQAISSTTKRIRRVVFENVTKERVYGAYLLGNVGLLAGQVIQHGLTPSTGIAASTLLQPALLSTLISLLSPTSSARPHRTLSSHLFSPNLDSVVISTLIPLAAAGSPVKPWGTGVDYLNALFISNSTILAAVGLKEGVWNTIKGAWGIGFGTINRAAVSLLTLAACVPIFGGMKSVSSQTLALNGAATVLTFAWLYRLRTSLRPRALAFALAGGLTALTLTTYFPALTSSVKLDTLIPVVFFRTYLATLPLTPLPALQAKKEESKPDPQKGLTAEQEREVDGVLEGGWYVLLRVWRAFM